MLLGPDEIAHWIAHRHRPGWTVWFGRSTGQYWALAGWALTLLGAATPDALDAAIEAFEALHPKPAHRDGGHRRGR